MPDNNEEDDYDNCFSLKEISNIDDKEAFYEKITDESEINKVYELLTNILSEEEIELEK